MDHPFNSQEFDDIYFSNEDGIAETEYVFLNGNRIPDCWVAQKNTIFRIGELGFGTGLNFFVTRRAWEQFENPPSVEFYSLEKFPLSADILLSLRSYFPNLKIWEEDLLKSYSEFLSESTSPDYSNQNFQYDSPHPNSSSVFSLMLTIGDVLDSVSKFKSPIDRFYLDGFAPKKNPEMWSLEVIKELKNLSKLGTSFSTFTASGQVRRNLEAAGFSVSKQKGFGRKREMLTGYYNERESL